MHIKKVHKAEILLTPPVSIQTKSGFVLLHTGEEIGYHVTEKREEVVYIIEGEARIDLDGEKDYIEAGSMVYLPPHKTYNIKNESEEDLKYMYVSSHFS